MDDNMPTLTWIRAYGNTTERKTEAPLPHQEIVILKVEEELEGYGVVGSPLIINTTITYAVTGRARGLGD